MFGKLKITVAEKSTVGMDKFVSKTFVFILWINLIHIGKYKWTKEDVENKPTDENLMNKLFKFWQEG